MRRISCFIVFVVCCVSSLLAQKKGAGYFGKRHFLNVGVSPLVNLFPTGSFRTNEFNYTHDWNNKMPKISVEIGHQNKNTTQWQIGASYYSLPVSYLSNFSREYFGNGMGESKSLSYKAYGTDYQFYVSGKKYTKGLAPRGVYYGVKVGLNMSKYTFQRTEVTAVENYTYNTSDRTVIVSKPAPVKFNNPFIGIHIGKTFLLEKHSTFDIGLRTSHFFGKRETYFVESIETPSLFKRNFYRLNLQALNSTHTFEIYAAFTLHY